MTSLVECHLEDVGSAEVSFPVLSYLQSMIPTGPMAGVRILLRDLDFEPCLAINRIDSDKLDSNVSKKKKSGRGTRLPDSTKRI
jgi:hypothetical protein